LSLQENFAVEMAAKEQGIRETVLNVGDVEKSTENVAVTSSSGNSSHEGKAPVPLTWKLMSIVLVTAIGFGSQWSSGITGAMKTAMKKEMDIDNKQFSLLEASEDFMVTALMLCSGIVTDRIGGAGKPWSYTVAPDAG
jgi:hypothetical protein